MNEFYQSLCEQLAIVPVTKLPQLNDYANPMLLAEQNINQRLTAALQVLLEMLQDADIESNRIDAIFLDHIIARIDNILTEQVDTILHHPKFQRLESLWLNLKRLVEKTDFNANIYIEILDVSKEELAEDFAEAVDIKHAGLYQHLYTEEYDMPGGEPIAAMISDYEFNHSAADLELLRGIAQVSALVHCPFIASVGASFFLQNDLGEVAKLNNLRQYMERAEYTKWNLFRETEQARYIGLTLPRYLQRLPYGEQNPVNSFNYYETIRAKQDYLWGNTSFLLAANLVKSFKYYGWLANIRGIQGGGKVSDLLLHHYQSGHGLQTKPPLEILIPESRELELAELGLIPLSFYKNTDYACFFSVNSLQKPSIYLDDRATANSRINARLPYLFLMARIAHYLKVIQRENIGIAKDSALLENELNVWLQSLVTKMNNPEPGLMATHPLREAEVKVRVKPDNPGYYQVHLSLIPHFQMEGIHINLSLISEMPAKQAIL